MLEKLRLKATHAPWKEEVISMKKDCPGPVMVSITFCFALLYKFRASWGLMRKTIFKKGIFFGSSGP